MNFHGRLLHFWTTYLLYFERAKRNSVFLAKHPCEEHGSAPFPLKCAACLRFSWPSHRRLLVRVSRCSEGPAVLVLERDL